MKKHLILTLLTASVVNIGCGQALKDKVYFDEKWNVVSDQSSAAYYRLYNAKDKSKGLKPYQDYYINGKLQGEGFYSRIENEGGIPNFIEEGEQKNYYDSGKLREKWTKKNNKIDGEDFLYYENGALKIQASFVDGVREGKAAHYDSTGRKMYDYNYQKGVLNGRQTMYLDNVHQVDIFDNGILQSETTYYLDGKTVRDVFTLKQIYDSLFTANVTNYYLDGYYEHTRAVKNSTDYLYMFMPSVLQQPFSLYRLQHEYDEYIIPHGKMQETDKQGRIVYQGQFRYGEQTGLWLDYYFDQGYYVSDNFDTGELRYYTLDNKPYTGSHTSYYGNDKVCETGQCKDGVRDGLWISYYNNGLRTDAKRLEVTYKNGVLDGEFKKYDTDGNVTTKSIYNNNKLVGNTYQYFYDDGCYEVVDFTDETVPTHFYTMDGKPFSGQHTEYRNLNGINEPVAVIYTISQSLITQHILKGTESGTVYQTVKYKNGEPVR